MLHASCSIGGSAGVLTTIRLNSGDIQVTDDFIVGCHVLAYQNSEREIVIRLNVVNNALKEGIKLIFVIG